MQVHVLRSQLHPHVFHFSVGGWCSGDAISSVERFEPRNNEWRMVSPMSKRRCGVGVAVLNNLLYAVGGHDGQSYLNSIERLLSLHVDAVNLSKDQSYISVTLGRCDPQTNQWSSDVAPTSSCRTSVGVAVLDGYLYAVGGQDGVSCLNFVEKSVELCNQLSLERYIDVRIWRSPLQV